MKLFCGVPQVKSEWRTPILRSRQLLRKIHDLAFQCGVRNSECGMEIDFRSVLGGRERFLEIYNSLNLHEKPAVNLREVEISSTVKPARRAWRMKKTAFGVRRAQYAADDIARQDVAVAIDFRAEVREAASLLKRLHIREYGRCGSRKCGLLPA